MNRLLVFAVCMLVVAVAEVSRAEEPLPRSTGQPPGAAAPFLRSESPGKEYLDLDVYPLEPTARGLGDAAAVPAPRVARTSPST